MSISLNKRVPSLDGLRAISIGAVLLGHLWGTEGFPLHAVVPLPSMLARYGVTIFFVISGFLITGLLMDEQQSSGRVSLRNFYLRRALRILPAFTLFLLVMVVARSADWVVLTNTDLLTALTWTVNFNPYRSWTIGHLWSLSAEEQFYLLWPATVVLLGFVRSRWLAIGAVLMAPVVRVAMRLAIHDPDLRDLEIFPAVADSVAIGCLLALYQPQLEASRWWSRLSSQQMFMPLLAVVAALAFYDGYTAVHFLGAPIILIATAAILHGCTRAGDTAVGRLLNNAPIMWVGRLSYSLYLWQQPFLNRAAHASFNSFPLNICGALACAMISYYLLERPFLRLRRRFGNRPTGAPVATGPSTPLTPAEAVSAADPAQPGAA